jgi:hypothetical protein
LTLSPGPRGPGLFSARGDIDGDQHGESCGRQADKDMANLIFKCPRTGFNVQHWLAEDAEPGDPHGTYDTVVCQACSGIHFINRSSGRLLGEADEE